MSRCEFAHGDLLVLHLHLVNSAQFPYLEKSDDFSCCKGSDLFPALGNGVFFFEAQGFSVGKEKREAKRTLTSPCRKIKENNFRRGIAGTGCLFGIEFCLPVRLREARLGHFPFAQDDFVQALMAPLAFELTSPRPFLVMISPSGETMIKAGIPRIPNCCFRAFPSCEPSSKVYHFISVSFMYPI